MTRKRERGPNQELPGFGRGGGIKNPSPPGRGAGVREVPQEGLSAWTGRSIALHAQALVLLDDTRYRNPPVHSTDG
jgi:hypothetical protein